MQSEQTTPPKRIWADPPETFDGMDIWRSEPGGKGVPYILAAPTALASSAEVQALLREARAQGMEEAANIAVRHDLSIMSISSADMRARQIAQAIRTAAAAALAEAQATIARQQVMLDRALEASFDDKARADRAEAENARLRDFWVAWAHRRLEVQRKHYLRDAKLALNGDMRALRNRVEMMEAEPMPIVPSAALSRPHATKGDD